MNILIIFFTILLGLYLLKELIKIITNIVKSLISIGLIFLIVGGLFWIDWTGVNLLQTDSYQSTELPKEDSYSPPIERINVPKPEYASFSLEYLATSFHQKETQKEIQARKQKEEAERIRKEKKDLKAAHKSLYKGL